MRRGANPRSRLWAFGAAGVVVLVGVGLPAPAQVARPSIDEADRCGYWTADPNVRRERQVLLSNILEIDGQQSRNFLGQARRPGLEDFTPSGQVVFSDTSRGAPEAVDRLLIAEEYHSDLGEQRVYRVPVALRVTHEEVPHRDITEFVTGRLNEERLVLVTYSLSPVSLRCVERPGAITLQPLEPDEWPRGLAGVPGSKSDEDDTMPRGPGSLAALREATEVPVVTGPRALGRLLPGGGETEAPGSFAELALQFAGSEASEAETAADAWPESPIASTPDSAAKARTDAERATVASGPVCLLGRAVAVNGALPAEAPIALAGLRHGASHVPLRLYYADLGLLEPSGFEVRLTSAPGTLDLLRSVGTLLPGTDRDSPFARLLVTPVAADVIGSARALDNDGEGPDTEAAAPLLHVFADPRIFLISGLEALDPLIADMVPGAVPRIHYYPIAGDGRVLDPIIGARFDDILVEAMFLPDRLDDTVYEISAVLERALSGMRARLTASDVAIDTAIWVLRGAQLPTQTPASLERFLREVPETAPIERLQGSGDRDARRWLYVLSGFFSQPFSEGYISGPVAVVRPPQALFSMAPAERSLEGPLLADPGRLLAQIQGNLRARLAAGDDAAVAPIGAAVDLRDIAGQGVLTTSAYAEVGLVVARDLVAELAILMAQAEADLGAGSTATPAEAGSVDPLALWLATTDGEGAVARHLPSAASRVRTLDRIDRLPGLVDAYRAFLSSAHEGLMLALSHVEAEDAADCGAVFVPLAHMVPLWAGDDE